MSYAGRLLAMSRAPARPRAAAHGVAEVHERIDVAPPEAPPADATLPAVRPVETRDAVASAPVHDDVARPASPSPSPSPAPAAPAPVPTAPPRPREPQGIVPAPERHASRVITTVPRSATPTPPPAEAVPAPPAPAAPRIPSWLALRDDGVDPLAAVPPSHPARDTIEQVRRWIAAPVPAPAATPTPVVTTPIEPTRDDAIHLSIGNIVVTVENDRPAWPAPAPAPAARQPRPAPRRAPGDGMRLHRRYVSGEE